VRAEEVGVISPSEFIDPFLQIGHDIGDAAQFGQQRFLVRFLEFVGLGYLRPQFGACRAETGRPLTLCHCCLRSECFS
jgi:hypothetical protein